MADSNITRRALASALKELMQERPFQKISVANICEKCDMNRKSFYYHFRDKYELMNWIFDMDFIHLINQYASDDTFEGLSVLATVLYENRKFYRNALSVQGQNSLGEHIREIAMPILSERLAQTMQGRDHLYGPGGNLSAKQFYAMQREGQFAATSQINPVTYRKAFESALQSGLDVVYLGFSSGLSGCFNNARLCMEELRALYPRQKLICIDTRGASIGLGFLVCEAARKQRQGKDIDWLAAWVERNKLKVCHWFTVDVFDHLRHGGRVSAASASVGSVLNIKPLLHVDEQGKLSVVKKPRGRRKAIAEQVALMQRGWTKEISPRIVIGHGDDPQAAELLRDAVRAHFPEAEIHIAEIGPIIGAHTGPGMLALVYWGDNR